MWWKFVGSFFLHIAKVIYIVKSYVSLWHTYIRIHMYLWILFSMSHIRYIDFNEYRTRLWYILKTYQHAKRNRQAVQDRSTLYFSCSFILSTTKFITIFHTYTFFTHIPQQPATPLPASVSWYKMRSDTTEFLICVEDPRNLSPTAAGRYRTG
jgi:hypothetical protein